MAREKAVVLKERTVQIGSEATVVTARRIARDMATHAEFDAIAAEEIALAVSELASNIVRYAGNGHIRLVHIEQDGIGGIQIDANDRGKGIVDRADAMTDGFSTGGGLGYGLGAVDRLMDRFDILPDSEGVPGTRIRCVRWNRGSDAPRIASPGDIGVVSRPKPGETENGDAYIIEDDGRTCLAAVIDGVGHGDSAHHAAMTARQYVETHGRDPLDRMIAGVDNVCRSTRGVVMAIVRINWGRQMLEHAGIGNIEVRFVAGGKPGALLSRRGILGSNAPGARIQHTPWQPGDLMAICSDGIRSSWEWTMFPSAALMPAQRLAGDILDAQARDGDSFDDATVAVLKYKAN